MEMSTFFTQFCLGIISNWLCASTSREVSLKENVYDFSVNYNQRRHHWGGSRRGGSVPPIILSLQRGPAFSGNICIANSAYSLSTIII